jgi:hypothetical protein
MECDTEAHRELLSLAWATIIIYPIGLLLGVVTLLLSARDSIRSGTPTALSKVKY